MAKLTWDAVGERLYETGVDHGVIYPMGTNGYKIGVAWNGLTGVTESPSGAEATPLYADNIKYLNLYSAEDFGGTIESYTYPDEFAECNGEAELVTNSGIRMAQQARKKFCFAYRTLVGNDEKGNEYGYKIHIVYGAQASPSETANATVNDSPEAITFSHEFTTTPVDVKDAKPTAHIEIDSTKFTGDNKAKLQEIEDNLFGRDADSTANPAVTAIDPHVLFPADLVAIMNGTYEYTPVQANG